jgi:hypothetical protein
MSSVLANNILQLQNLLFWHLSSFRSKFPLIRFESLCTVGCTVQSYYMFLLWIRPRGFPWKICQKFGRAPWPEGWPNARCVLMQDNKTHKHRYIHLPMHWDGFKLMIHIWNYYNPTELYCTMIPVFKWSMTAHMISPFTGTWHCYSPFPHAEGK